ncbi:MAG: RNA 2'-phosphotransferase [Chloroflexi bacterium]|nr:RNA 2'-phosphotransferase [Chloroflexota bacterium]
MADRRRMYKLRKLSKFLSLLLRHRPARFPIEMDAAGYAALDEVMHMLNGLPNFRWATRDDVQAVVDADGQRKRFELDEGRIRALYGHTALRPTYEPVTPPERLYHGTAPGNLDAIWREGLQPMQRQYVHLAHTPEGALGIGRRHARDPVLLHIAAAAAHAAGIAFYHPVKEIYLVEQMPPQYIEAQERSEA